MEINEIPIVIWIVLGTVCILCICHLCYLWYEDPKHTETLENIRALPATYENVVTNPPSYSEACGKITI